MTTITHNINAQLLQLVRMMMQNFNFMFFSFVGSSLAAPISHHRKNNNDIKHTHTHSQAIFNFCYSSLQRTLGEYIYNVSGTSFASFFIHFCYFVPFFCIFRSTIASSQYYIIVVAVSFVCGAQSHGTYCYAPLGCLITNSFFSSFYCPLLLWMQSHNTHRATTKNGTNENSGGKKKEGTMSEKKYNHTQNHNLQSKRGIFCVCGVCLPKCELVVIQPARQTPARLISLVYNNISYAWQ